MKRLIAVLILAGCVSSPAAAQVTSAAAQTAAEERTERPATASYWGDTGLWFVPTAEVVRAKGWSFSIYRTEFDFTQGNTDVSDWPLTMAVGAGPRTEIFGALRIVTRIDRDLNPLFVPESSDAGGVVNDRPFVRETWTGNAFGDLFLGAKINLLSERLNQPFALAFRGTWKLPTADDEKGAGTGEQDFFTDVVVSKEAGRAVELTAFTGYAFRGDPDNLNLSNGLRWGGGAAFGARANLRLTTEIFGEISSNDDVEVIPPTVTGVDGSLAPILSTLDKGVTTAFGLTWQHSSGFSLGAGLTWQFGLDDDNIGVPSDDNTGQAVGMQFRLGFHNGVRVFRPPAPRPIAAVPEPAPAPAPVAPQPAPNRQPTLTALCDPCRVEIGRTASIRADAQDADGDPLIVRWTTPAGALADPGAATTTWTAGSTPGPVTLTVTANDGRGGVATSTVRLDVVAPVATAADFQDVLFEFDRADLLPEGRVILDRAAGALMRDTTLQLVVEGHASYEGTEEHNLELGERRARAAFDYLSERGVDASRMKTVSYGETRPKFDNSREETRRLNRRAALVPIVASQEVR